MEGFVGSNGVSPFADHVCQSRSQHRTRLPDWKDVSLFNGLFSSHDFGRLGHGAELSTLGRVQRVRSRCQ
jgi:hypothetical protein